MKSFYKKIINFNSLFIKDRNVSLKKYKVFLKFLKIYYGFQISNKFSV